MRWYVSYPILAAGLAFGADTFFPGEPSVARPLPEPAAAIAVAAPLPEVLTASEFEAEARLAAFSPGAVLLAAVPPQKSVLDYLARSFTPSAPAPSAVVPPPQPVTATAWTSAVIRDERLAADPALAPPVPRAATSRVALARDIQRELRRVGCYLGEIDGVWGSGSKRATLVFMDRVNASLPTQDPDVFMLSLLRAQDELVCGPACPRGQSATAGGRCVPSTLVAQADRAEGDPRARRQRRETARDTATRVVTAEVARPPPAAHARMGIGGPRPDDLAPVGSAWTAAEDLPTPPAPSLARTGVFETASIEGEAAAIEPGRALKITRTAVEAGDEPPAARRAKPSRSKAVRASPQRTSSYRQVQRLFLHPLGRM